MRWRPFRGAGRVGALLAAIPLAACDTPPPAPPQPATSILLLVSDALRADALSCYGGPAQTPNICGLAERGVLFERAFSGAPWTLPSSVAMFTGSYPSRWATPDSEGDGGLYYVPEGERLLAEVLADAGYATVAWVENKVALRGNGMQGFEQQRPGREATDEILGRLDPLLGLEMRDHRYREMLGIVDFLLTAGDRPFFALKWIDDPHATYDPPPGFEIDFAAGSLPRDEAFYRGLGHHHRPQRNLRRLRAVVDELGDDELAVVRALYHREIEAMDERVGLVLRALELGGRTGDTLVVFTSDHGEAFGEHGTFLHGETYYDELVRVPWILAGPDVPSGVRVSAPVTLVDLVPTLWELVGVPGQPTGLHGTSLVPFLDGSVPRRGRGPLYLASPFRVDGSEAVVDGDFKLIVHADGSRELYDLVADPGERQDIATARPEIAVALSRRLRDLQRMARPAALASTEQEARERAAEEARRELQAVGYID